MNLVSEERKAYIAKTVSEFKAWEIFYKNIVNSKNRAYNYVCNEGEFEQCFLMNLKCLLEHGAPSLYFFEHGFPHTSISIRKTKIDEKPFVLEQHDSGESNLYYFTKEQFADCAQLALEYYYNMVDGCEQIPTVHLLKNVV